MELGPEASRLHDLLRSKLGPEADLLSATILHGGGSETRAIGDEVRALADAARASDGVAHALETRDFEGALSSRSEPWASELAAFIEDHADEIPLWFELHEPAWNEDPMPLARMIAATLQAPAAGRRDASAAALADVRARLAADDLPAFEAALATSRNYVPVIEHRARWQLKLAGALRKAIVELGKKFHAAGKLDSAGDIFFLHLDELDAVAAGALDPRASVASRRAEWKEQLRLEAPIMIGLPIPFEMLGAANPMLRRMFGAVALQPATESAVHGVGASAGVVRGRARVVMSLVEADGIEDGDILVCPSTSPPWSPYFAVVAGVVTDAGGMISHAAIEAREYGIPAVVGTREGTARIPDGATITIDGTAGTVTIER
jgi:pyruvate,water dikinase